MVEQKNSDRLAALVGEKLADPGVVQKLTAWDVFQKCSSQVIAAKRKGIAWEDIAQSIQAGAKEVYGVEIRLSARTAADYYYRLTHRKKKKQRKSSTARARKTTSILPPPPAEKSGESLPLPDSRQIAEEPIEALPSTVENQSEQPEPPDPKPPSKRQQQKNTRFNLSTRPGAKPINIL